MSRARRLRARSALLDRHPASPTPRRRWRSTPRCSAGSSPARRDARRSAGRYFVARLRGRDVAGIGSQPAAGRAAAGVEHVRVRRERRGDRRAGARRGRRGPRRALRRAAGRSPGRARRSGGRGVRGLGARGAQGRAARQRARSVGDEPPRRRPIPTRAAAFYGALFGWTTETFGEGDGAMTMFRLPGYVGGEPQQPVSREVVATMAAMRDDGGPRWSVNFWDHDVDATAATGRRARRRAPLVAPFDTPMTRTAVLADPHGADVHHQQRPRLTEELPMANAHRHQPRDPRRRHAGAGPRG